MFSGFFKWIDIIALAIKRFSREIFHFKLSISLWNSPFLNVRQHSITNIESDISSLMFKVFIWIGCYTGVLYLGKFSWCSWQNCVVWLCCISLSILFTLHLNHYDVTIIIAFGIYGVFILCLQRVSGYGIYLDRMSIHILLKIVKNLARKV